jgi:hypothetical protein
MLRLSIGRKVNLMIRGQILRWRVHVHNVRIQHHWHRLEDPKAPFRRIGVRRDRVKECRCAKRVAQQDENAGDVQRVDDDFDPVREHIGMETAEVEDDDQGDEGEEEDDLEQ